MKKDDLHYACVQRIIGDIPQVFSSMDDDEVIEPLSDEEVAEIEAEFEAMEAISPHVWTEEDQLRAEAFGKKIGQYCTYKLGMMAQGLGYLDFYEWENMAEKPQVPEKPHGP